MRLISFAETIDQIKNKTKTVTRRMGWEYAKIGDLLQPVNKCMGLKKGEHPIIIQCPIRVIHNDREPLWMIGEDDEFEDCAKEGFPDLTPDEFIEMFCRINRAKKCTLTSFVSRIEFEYTE